MTGYHWLDWQFQDDPAELTDFLSRDTIRTLGSYTPGRAPVIFNPLSVHNEVPEATLLHEGTHAELIRTTAYGLFFELLHQLRHIERFRNLLVLTHSSQWQVQEACATYSGLALIAFRKPGHFGEAIDQLPVGRRGEPPYREAFETINSILPIELGAAKTRLQAHQFFATGIGRLSLDNDCLVRFSDPETLTMEAWRNYLDLQSPNRRFGTIVNALSGRPEIPAVVDAIERSIVQNTQNPARVAMDELTKLVPGINQISFGELGVQHGRFRENWQPIVDRFPPTDGDPRNWDNVPEIPAVNRDIEAPMTLAEARLFFQQASESNIGLWAVIAITDESQTMLLDLLPYPLGEDGNPVSEEAAARAVLETGFSSGRLAIDDVVQLFDAFPHLPTAITFIGGSWYVWAEHAEGHAAGRRSVQVCLTRDLSEVSFQIMLAFRDLRSRARYFVSKLDDDQAMAFFVDLANPDAYALQYLAGNVGHLLVQELARKFDIMPLQDSNAHIPHLELLKMMALPSFLGAD